MLADGNWRPRLESPESIRQLLAFATLVCVAALVYASLMPFESRTLSWGEACDRWRSIPWLNLSIYYRADWVANALVVLPAGFLAAAAVDWGRPSHWPLVIATPIITLALVLIVIGIELLQVWFPPRTVSLNDIAAGFIGAALGPVAWAISGPFVEQGVTQFFHLPRVRDRLEQLCVLWLVAVVVYSVLPLDVIVSSSEWQRRLAGERVQLNPFASQVNGRSVLLDFFLSALRMGPIGVLVYLASERRRGWRSGLWWLPIVLELIQVPIYSKFVTLTAVVGGWIGGWTGYFAGSQLDQLLHSARKPAVWAWGWGLSYVATVALLLGNFEQVITDPVLIGERLNRAWSLPLVKYYVGSEYLAYTSIAEKMLLFGASGGCCAGWMGSVSRQVGRRIFWASLIAVVVTAFAIEFLQVLLSPFVPDISDALIYLSGYAGGYFAVRVVSGRDWSDSQPELNESLRAEAEPRPRADRVSASDKNNHREFLLTRFISALVGLFGLTIAMDYPFGAGWGLAQYVGVMVVLALRPQWWLLILPFAIVAGDLYLWTGSLMWTESDLFCLAALTVLLWREGAAWKRFYGNIWLLALWAPLALSLVVSAYRGWNELVPLAPGDQLSLYFAQENVFRVAKGFIWGLLFAPFVIDAVRARGTILDVVRSLRVAALFVGIGVILERVAAVGLMNFGSVYRASGFIASMHIGGQHIDTFWVLVLPLLFLPRVGELSPTRLLARLGILAIALYSIIATLSRALIAIAAIELVISVGMSIVNAGKGIGIKILAGIFAVGIVATALWIGFVASNPIEQRFSTSVSDASTRWDHWLRLSQATGADLLDVTIGRGLGTVPTILSKILGSSSRPAEAVVDETDGPLLRMRPGRLYFVEQLLKRPNGKQCRLRGEFRANGPMRCTVSVCRKTLVQSYQCASVNLPPYQGSGEWQPIESVVDLADVMEAIDSPCKLPVVFSLIAAGGESIEFRNLSFQDDLGQQLLKNPDFSAGSRYWVFTSDDHLQWHAKNIWVHLRVEQGWVGVVAFAWLMTGTCWFGVRRALKSGDAASWLFLLSIAGALAIGMVESIFDTPWITSLLLVFVAVAQANALLPPLNDGVRGRVATAGA